jgi:predicted DNA binding CopG/RHH family protein
MSKASAKTRTPETPGGTDAGGKRAFPRFDTDADAERFVDEADLTQYDFSGFRPLSHELERKSQQVNLRMPVRLVERLKAEAARRDIPYQRLIREAVEKALG